jgi:S-formylglutathione hydrolase
MRSWWADRICRAFDPVLSAKQHLIDNVIPWMNESLQLKPRTIAAVGVSMGGQGAVRLGFQHPDLLPVVASVGGAFDYHELHGQGLPLDEMYPSKELCRLDTALLHVDPNHVPQHIWFACDPTDVQWYRGNDRLHEKLSALGVSHVADLETSAGGHSWTYFDRMAEPMMAFVADSLKSESRRLV